jgi:nucleotide-binding universal stress UspA family protein
MTTTNSIFNAGKPRLEKVKILVPLDQPDILGAVHEDTPPDYKLVFEESMDLAEALNAEVVLLHVASREDEESIRSSSEPGSDRFYSPEDLRGLKVLGHSPNVDDLLKIGVISKISDDEVNSWIAWATPLTYQLQEPIQKLLAKARDQGIRTRAMSMLDGKSLIICKSAQEWDTDVIVMGRGKAAGWRSFWFDRSVSTYVLHNAPCSVALVDEHLKEVPKIEKILVALDHFPTSREIFLQAVNLAERIRAAKQSLNPNIADKEATPALFLLHVTSPFEQDNLQMLRSFEAWAQERNIPVQYAQKPALKVKEYLTEVRLQPNALPGQVICEMATEWGADLIVLGYRREWELKKLMLGSVCNYVTRHAPCSVFVVKSFKPFDIEIRGGSKEQIGLPPDNTGKENTSLPTNS